MCAQASPVSCAMLWTSTIVCTLYLYTDLPQLDITLIFLHDSCICFIVCYSISLCASVCVVCVCVCVCVCTYVCRWVHACICMCVNTGICTYITLYVCVCVCTCMCVYVYMHTHTHMYVHTRIILCVHVLVHMLRYKCNLTGLMNVTLIIFHKYSIYLYRIKAQAFISYK